VLAEELATGELAQPPGTAVAVIGVEHDSPATGFELEEIRDDARQQQRSDTAVEELEVRDGRVQTDVIRISVITRGDGILCRPVEFDVTDVARRESCR